MSFKDINNGVVPPKIAGIRANIPFYQLAWQINKSYAMNLALNLPWEKPINEEKDCFSFHQHYFDVFEDVELNWHLIQNKGSESWFLQSKPMFDYLLICNGDDIYAYFEKAVEAIKQNNKIEFIHAFNFDLVKSKDAFFHNIIQSKLYLEDLNHV